MDFFPKANHYIWAVFTTWRSAYCKVNSYISRQMCVEAITKNLHNCTIFGLAIIFACNVLENKYIISIRFHPNFIWKLMVRAFDQKSTTLWSPRHVRVMYSISPSCRNSCDYGKVSRLIHMWNIKSMGIRQSFSFEVCIIQSVVLLHTAYTKSIDEAHEDPPTK